MINLLPDKEKRDIAHEYQFRRLAVALVLLFSLTALVAVMLMPSYFVSLYKLKSVNESTTAAHVASKQTESNLRQELGEVRTLVKALAPETYTAPSEIVDLIIQHKTGQNKITSITYSRQSSQKVTAVVQGVAETRRSLVSFTDALTRESIIEKLDIPVSNFAKDRSIPFTFTLTVKK